LDEIKRRYKNLIGKNVNVIREVKKVKKDTILPTSFSSIIIKYVKHKTKDLKET